MSTHLLSGARYEELVVNYRETRSDEAFSQLYEAVKKPIRHTIGKLIYTYPMLYTHESDLHALADEKLLEAVEKFNGGRGSNFLSYLVQRIKWGVSDFQKSLYAGQSEFYREMTDIEGAAEVGLRVGTPAGQQKEQPIDFVHYEVFGGEPLRYKLEAALEEFEETGKTLETRIIRIYLESLVENSQFNNDALYAEFPDRKPRDLRKYKQRAFQRFAKFLQKTGREQEFIEYLYA